VTIERLPIDGAAIQLWSHPVGAALWDVATWGGATWSTEDWRDVSCQVTAARTSWGANRSLGVLSIAAGGAWSVETYDPDRLLDPSNTSSPFAGAIRPGAYMRLLYGADPLAFAILDEIDYSLRHGVGRIQGTDPVGVLSNVQVPAPASPAGTLRAYARQLKALTQYQALVVEADPPEGDVAIGSPDTPATGLINVWQAIQAAANDALHFAWVDAALVIRFRSHGDPYDRGLTLGLEGIPVIEQVMHSNADGIVNKVTAKDLTGPAFTIEDPESQKRFGLHAIDRGTRKVPDAASWAARLLEDRATASLEYLPVQIIPTLPEHLHALSAMGGVDLVRIRLDVPDPIVSADVRSLGLQLDASPEGWSAAVLGYVSGVEWSAGTEPPEPPIDPSPPPTQQVTRSYTSAKSSRIAKTSGGAKYGSGAEAELPVGSWTGWQNRALIEFPISIADAKEIVSATLRLKTSSQVNIGFGSTPKVRVNRATAAWTEGTLTSPGSGNAVVWPGPAYTSTGQAVHAVSDNEGATIDINVLAIVKAWAPTAAGGSAAANRGFVITSYTETADKYTTEFLSDDTGTAGNRPQLIIVLKIPA